MGNISLSNKAGDAKYDAAQFFDKFAEAFDTIYDKKRNLLMQWVDRQFRRDMFIRFALSFEALGDLTGKTILDIGCGSGPYVVEALHRGASHVTAVDPSPNMLALVRARLNESEYTEKCLLVQGVFPGVDLTEHDHSIVMGVMDYISDARGFLTALRPLVTKSAVVSFPSRHWFRTRLREFRYWLRKCPVYFYDESQIRYLCSAAAFDRIEIKKIPGAGMDYHVCLKP